VTHRTTPAFWKCYRALPASVRALADKNFALLKADSSHPSLHFKRVREFWSARVGSHYRALALQEGEQLFWFWIGPHAQYNYLIR